MSIEDHYTPQAAVPNDDNAKVLAFAELCSDPIRFPPTVCFNTDREFSSAEWEFPFYVNGKMIKNIEELNSLPRNKQYLAFKATENVEDAVASVFVVDGTAHFRMGDWSVELQCETPGDAEFVYTKSRSIVFTSANPDKDTELPTALHNKVSYEKALRIGMEVSRETTIWNAVANTILSNRMFLISKGRLDLLGFAYGINLMDRARSMYHFFAKDKDSILHAETMPTKPPGVDLRKAISAWNEFTRFFNSVKRKEFPASPGAGVPSFSVLLQCLPMTLVISEFKVDEFKTARLFDLPEKKTTNRWTFRSSNKIREKDVKMFSITKVSHGYYIIKAYLLNGDIKSVQFHHDGNKIWQTKSLSSIYNKNAGYKTEEFLTVKGKSSKWLTLGGSRMLRLEETLKLLGGIL